MIPHGSACIDHQVDREVRVLLKSFGDQLVTLGKDLPIHHLHILSAFIRAVLKEFIPTPLSQASMNARHRTIHDDSSEKRIVFNPFEVCGVEKGILHGLDHKSKSLNFSGRYGFKQMLDNLVGTQALGFGKETWQHAMT